MRVNSKLWILLFLAQSLPSNVQEGHFSGVQNPEPLFRGPVQTTDTRDATNSHMELSQPLSHGEIAYHSVEPLLPQHGALPLNYTLRHPDQVSINSSIPHMKSLPENDNKLSENPVDMSNNTSKSDRLNKAYASAIPLYSGKLPTEYFDQPVPLPPPQVPKLESNNANYHPVTYRIESLLQNPAPTLSPFVVKPKELNIYCYPFDESEIMQKCKNGLTQLEATGMLIPMMNEIQTPKSARYYDYLRRIRQEKSSEGANYKIYGVAYDNPNWELITDILMKNENLFDGIVIEWVGPKACVWNIRQPSLSQVQIIEAKAGLPINYFFRQQDCDAFLLRNSTNKGAFYNPNSDIDSWDLTVKRGEWPKFLKYLFPCFQGEEGPCYKAVREHPAKACNSQLQKYVYSPYEPLGALMMYLKNETCHGLDDHDLYSVV